MSCAYFRAAALACACLWAMPLPVHAQADVLRAAPALIVLLQSYDTSSEWEHDVSEGVFARLLDGGINADLREEYLDARRHDGLVYRSHMRDLLVSKYASTPPRLVITADDAALEFLLDYPEVFAGIPVVFGGVQNESVIARAPRSRMTGVREAFGIHQIIEATLAARPSAQRLFIVTPPTSSGEGFRAQFAAAAPRYPRVTFVSLSTGSMTVKALLEHLKTDVAPVDAVIAAPIVRDITGRAFDARLVMPDVVGASRAPVVAIAYDDRRQGLLAVTASTGVTHGRLMANKALQVLAGAPPASIAIDIDVDSPLEFDARVLARFGIPEDRLPSGTTVINRTPPSFYEANRLAIWSTAAFIGLQSLVIGGLVRSRVRRRRAEATRDNQARALVAANRALEESNRSLIREQDERLRIEEDLRHAQKMEAVGRLAGGVAHDFNNLLTVTLGYCELLRMRVRGGSAEFEALEQIRKASEQAATLTHNLLAFSRKQVSLPVTIEVTSAVRGLEPMLRRFCGERISLALHMTDEPGCVELGAGQLEQVAMNLVINASDAMPDGGFLEVATRVEQVGADGATPTGLRVGKHVVLTVTDTGTGMDPATRARIFEPFFTTKEIGRGTGLGLATVYAIVTQRGGRIAVESQPGHGSTFAVWLPAVACRQEVVDITTAEVPASGGRTVLVVEDEEDLRTLVCLLLRDAGYAVLEAAGGDEAFLVSAHHDGPIDLLLTDLVMPEQDGFTVARRLRHARPGIAVAYMSGYTERIQGHDDEPMLLLGKPFLPEALFAHVRRALDDASPRAR